MFRSNPIFRFIYITFTLLLLLTFSTPILSSTDPDSGEGIEELIALDEEQETHGQVAAHHVSEAEVLSKAQRVVLELNIDITERVLRENEYVLVLGYAPWCARSAELMPKFAEAAMVLKELGSPLLMAKIDAERYPKAASILGIKGFPTLFLFVNGSSQLYTGGFTGEDIVIWARKKTGVPVVRVSSIPEAEEVVKKYSDFVIGRFEKFEGPCYEEFIKAAASDNEIQFVEVSDIEVAKVLFPDVKPISPFLGLVKSEAEKYTTFEGSFTEDKMLEFLNYNKFRLVNILTELNSARIYSSPIKLQVFVFAKADEFEKLLEPLQNVARKFLSQILFVLVDIAEENLSKPFLTLFGLEDTKKTVVSAFDNNVSSKYLLESEPTPSHLKEFCRRLLLGTQPPYFKSQPVPDNTEAMIQIVVGKTFDDLVLNSPKNVLLEVHAPWCINCEATSKHVEKLAKHFKGLDTLVFARLDASANEHPKLKVDDYPTLLFYPVGDKLNPIKLSTRTGVKELAASINKNLKAKAEATKDEL